MDKDLHHLESMVKDLSANITHWDTDKVFEKAKEMFDADEADLGRMENTLEERLKVYLL